MIPTFMRRGLLFMALILSGEARADTVQSPMVQGPLLEVRLKLTRSCNFKAFDGPNYEVVCTTIVPMVVTVMSDADDNFQETVPIMPDRRNRLELSRFVKITALRLVIDY